MSTTSLLPRVLPAVGLALALAVAGCEAEQPTRAEPKPRPKPPEAKRVQVGKNVSLEVQGDQRRVRIESKVCLNKGPLELLLCPNNTKEHEAVLHAEVDGRDVHKALLLAKAEAGSPVQFAPKYRPASGTRIKVMLEYEEKGKKVRVPAQKWIKNMKDGKDLDSDWVFGGSRLVANALDDKAPPRYLANDGDLICISNFDDAMLDLPINSPKEDADRAYEANAARIPAIGTPVVVILEPVIEAKKPAKK